jgi:SpoVK/Ycf46/Vps4 family AAA+-type ATPase
MLNLLMLFLATQQWPRLIELLRSRMNIIYPFRNTELFQKFKKRAGGGSLCYGPPGCGKTHIARATAGECEAGFISLAITDVLSK